LRFHDLESGTLAPHHGQFQFTDAIRDLAHFGKKVKALELSGAWADVRAPEILARLNGVR
jgi:dTDP-glucose pyrophosphorylase